MPTLRWCLAGKEQYCCGVGSFESTNHLHHEDGAFQEYIYLDAGYLAILSDDLEPVLAAPVLCAGLPACKAVKNASLSPGHFLVVIGAGGSLGQYAVQYGLAHDACVIGVNTGAPKEALVSSLDAAYFVDYKRTPNPVSHIQTLTDSGAHAVIVTAGLTSAFAAAASLLRTEGTMCCIGIPPGGGPILTSVAGIVIKEPKIQRNLVGGLRECMAALALVKHAAGKPKVYVRPFMDVPKVYEELDQGHIAGRVVLKVGEDAGADLALRKGNEL